MDSSGGIKMAGSAGTNDMGQGNENKGNNSVKASDGKKTNGDDLQVVWGLSLPGTFVQANNYQETLDFILKCKDNSPDKAAKFLQETLGFLRKKYQLDASSLMGGSSSFGAAGISIPGMSGGDDSKASGVGGDWTKMNDKSGGAGAGGGKSFKDRPFDAFVGDEIDDKPTTLVLLVPGQAHIIGHLIGKSGSEISKLESSANVTIRVESKNKMPLGSSERRIYVVGSVANGVYTQQMITERIHEKLKEEGVQQELIKIVIPHESVPHLIGKGGSSIKRLQELSGARIQVEQETAIVPGTIGRAVTIQGTRYERSMAQYLISRQMAENRSTRKEWQGGVPQPHPGPMGGGMSSLQGSNPQPLAQGTSTGILRASISKAPEGGSSGLSGMTKPSGVGSRGREDSDLSQPFANTSDYFLPGDLRSGGAGGDSTNPYGLQSAFGAGGASGFQTSRSESTSSAPGYDSWYNGGGRGMNAASRSMDPFSSAGRAAANVFDTGPDDNARMQGGPNAVDDGYQAQYQTLVPDSAVAHLIGRAGSVISEIQKKSGTKISFAKTNANPESGMDVVGGFHGTQGVYQKVTITGTQQAIGIAQNLISEKLVELVGDF